jgi:hypothetical protein
MAERSTARDDRQNRFEFYLLTHFPAMWHALQRSRFWEPRVNQFLINRVVAKMPARPYPLSTMSSFTSWASLPGVIAVEGRLVTEVELEQEMGRRPRVIGRLLSLPPGREPAVNQVRLLEGRPLSPLALVPHCPRREVLLEASFARAHHYHPGDRLRLILQRARVAFTVVGIVASPEYIYPVWCWRGGRRHNGARSAMAFAVTYTATDSVLWERTLELATLRTLGFGMARLTLLVTVENLLTAAAGAAVGAPADRCVAAWLIATQHTGGFSIHAVVEPRTYLLEVGSTFLLVLLAQWPGLLRIRHLDLAASIRLRDE